VLWTDEGNLSTGLSGARIAGM